MIFACLLLTLPARAIPAGSAPSSRQASAPEQAKSPDQAKNEEPDPLDSPIGESMRWLNFLIVFGAAGYFIAKKGGPMFRARAKEISSGITSAAAAKAEADAQLRKAEAGLARLDQDTAVMREESKKEFASEIERLNAAGQQEIARIESAATAEINAARRAAQIELRAAAARLAAARAAEIFKQQVTAAQGAALVKRFVDELPAAGGVN
jgi:F0F1-type ATP synthase membrane subunit b/b'